SGSIGEDNHRTTASSRLVPRRASAQPFPPCIARCISTRSTAPRRAPYSARGAYVNFLMNDEGQERVKKSYGDNYERLAAIKRKYDPANFFRVKISSELTRTFSRASQRRPPRVRNQELDSDASATESNRQ